MTCFNITEGWTSKCDAVLDIFLILFWSTSLMRCYLNDALHYMWNNLMVVSSQNETLCNCFILEESPKVALFIDITEPLADIRSWDGEWLYYIVWPDHAVILGHFLARPLNHCLEGKNQWQLTFGHFIWLSPQKYKQCWLRCSSWSIWALFNLETFLGEMTTTWYFSYKKAEKIDNAN